MEHEHKKLLILIILEILNRYTDSEHTLTQADILKIVKNEYGMTVERKAVKRNLMELIAYGYNINYTETPKKIKKKNGKYEDSPILSDFYINRTFSNSELILLIDSVLFAKNISMNKSNELIKKLGKLSNTHFNARIKNISKMPSVKSDNEEIFANIQALDAAIQKKVKVEFNYTEYHTDKKLHLRRDDEGHIRTYLMNPYRLAVNEGNYYLICNKEDYDNLANYRVDRIRDIKITDMPVKPFNTLEGISEDLLDVNDYMRKHVFMFSGSDKRIVFRANKCVLSDIIDMFGKKISFKDETMTHVTVIADVTDNAMIQFAIRFAPFVTVLEPQPLADEIRTKLKDAVKEYNKALKDYTKE